jgi:hypothetical protein
MELRYLRCFLAVAEELHFARAAEKLHVEQSPLSRAIKELEEEIGAHLFARTTRLTRACRHCLRRPHGKERQSRLQIKTSSNRQAHSGCSRLFSSCLHFRTISGERQLTETLQTE